MTTVNVYSKYTVFGSTELIELPKGKSTKDIKEIYIKWGSGQIEFKDGTTLDFNEDQDNIHEFLKHPDEIRHEGKRQR